MRSWLAALSIILLILIPGVALADLDVAGNVIGDGEPGPAGDDPGDPCGTCPAPAGDDAGVDFKNGELWVVGQGGTLYHLVNCVPTEQITLQGVGLPAFGLGYDSMRDLWIVTSPGTDRVYQVNAAGGAVNSWATPGSGPVGAAYDSNRDLYWITDFATNQIYSIRPSTGQPGPVINAPAGSRLAGTGYDPIGDILFYHGRDQAMSYCISAASGQLLFSFPIPMGGTNNGQGAGIAPNGNGHLSHFEQPTIFCVEGCSLTTSVESSTWGAIKSIYE